jgi:hypothetical protein
MGHRVQPDKIVELLRSILVLALFFGSCGPAPDRAARQPPPGGPADSLVVDSAEAVFFSQDSLRMAQIKIALREQVYASLTHDCYFETKYAQTVIQRDRPSLRIIHTSAHRWLIFKKKDGTIARVDLNAINDLCGLLLFDGSKDPLRANMPNIATDLWNYFGRAGE